MIRVRILFAACLAFLCASVQAQTRDLRPVLVPQGHDPLYVDPATVSRSGSQVSFKYVLDVPAALQGGEPGRWRSNQMTAIIDCAAKTISVTYAESYAGPRATGNVISRYTLTAAERKPDPFVPGGTAGALAEHLCPR